MRRVVHVASGREWRGGQRQVYLLARELQRLGDVSQVVVTGRGSELAGRLRNDGIATHEVGWRAGLDPRALAGVLRECRRPALLHAHDAHSLTLAGLAGWLTGTPLIVTRRVDFPLRRRGFWARAVRVIAVSEAVAAVLRSDGIDPRRIVVIRSGIDLTDGARARPAGIRSRLALGPESRLAVTVGALVPHKDHATLIHAAARLAGRDPDLHWIVVGEGPLRPVLERLIATKGLSGRVHLLGHLEEPLGVVAEADVFVMSSREEGLGTSVLDALACGIPVASTDAGGLPEMLGDGVGVLVPAGRPDLLGDAVARILADPALRAELGSRGARAVRRFSAERMAAEVARVYRSCGSDT